MEPSFSLILLAWIGFIGASLATREFRHIQVDALSKLWPEHLRPVQRRSVFALGGLLSLHASFIGYDYVFGPNGPYDSDERDPQTGLPSWTVMFAVVVAFVLMSIRFAAQLALAFAGSASAKAFAAMVGGVILFASLCPSLVWGHLYWLGHITSSFFRSTICAYRCVDGSRVRRLLRWLCRFSSQLLMRGCWTGAPRSWRPSKLIFMNPFEN